jgi:ribonuclease J
MTSSTFQFWSLGGSGEVGMNSLFMQFGETLVPIDAGILFADPNDFGIENLHADYTRFFSNHSPSHWLITHAHEDHIGAVAAMLEAAALHDASKVPTVYAPLFACELIREKISDDVRYPRARRHLDKLTAIRTGEDVVLGPGLKLRYVEVRHSTLQCHSLAFEWQEASGDVTRVLHSSDFKIDEHSYEDGTIGLDAFDCFDGQSPDFLFIDSTNAEREGHTVAEKTVIPNLKKLIEAQEGRVYVSLFSSNVYRMAALMALAEEVGRSVCLAGRSFNTVHRIARDHGLYGKSCPSHKGAQLGAPEDVVRRDRRHQLVLCSGSQGEKRSVLARMSQGKHPEFRIAEGDAVILSSKTIPGNEKPIARLINGLLRQGAKVYWGESAKIVAGGPIHGSGHARRDEISAVIARLKPRHVIPVHGELRQMKACSELATQAGAGEVHVCENLTRLKFERSAGAEWKKTDVETLPYEGRILRFENFTTHSLDPFLRVRKRAAQGGLVSLCLDSMGRVKVACEGVVPILGEHNERMTENLHNQIEDWAQLRFKYLSREGVFHLEDRTTHENDLADELSRFVRKFSGVRPFVVVHLMGL